MNLNNKENLPEVTPLRQSVKHNLQGGKFKTKNMCWGNSVPAHTCCTSGHQQESTSNLHSMQVRLLPHGSVLDLIQMVSTNIRHALKEGNFFCGKNCADCITPIAELFTTSNNKALFISVQWILTWPNWTMTLQNQHPNLVIACCAFPVTLLLTLRNKHQEERSTRRG
jgi:hypothetical protein